MEEKENKKQVRNYAVLISVCALILGTIAGFLQRDNTFQALAFLVVALVMIAVFALKMKSKKEENKE